MCMCAHDVIRIYNKIHCVCAHTNKKLLQNNNKIKNEKKILSIHLFTKQTCKKRIPRPRCCRCTKSPTIEMGWVAEFSMIQNRCNCVPLVIAQEYTHFYVCLLRHFPAEDAYRLSMFNLFFINYRFRSCSLAVNGLRSHYCYIA